MQWDLTLEKLRREAFRPSVPPPVRMPRWAVAALVGAGLTLSGAACDRSGSSGSDTAADMGRVQVEYGAPMPPEPADMPLDPSPEKPLYAAPPPQDPMTVEVPPPVEEYRAPIMKEPIEQAPPVELEMKTPVKHSISVPVYGPPPIRQDMRIGPPKPMYGIAPMPPPPQAMYGGPDIDDF